MTYVINWILQKRHGEEMYSVEIYNNLVITWGDMWVLSGALKPTLYLIYNSKDPLYSVCLSVWDTVA